MKLYVRNTNDDLSIMQIHFFDSSFESLIGFNTDLPTMLTKLAAKTYRARTPVNIGLAINATIARILANGFLKGVPQIIALVTHSASVDNVVDAGKYAMSLGISIVCISFGAGTNNAQLLQLANTQSNIINVPNSSSLSSLTGLLSNFFCKQHIDVRLSSIVPKNVVRVETSPSYFRVEKSSTQTYQLVISYQTDPEVSGELLIESFVDPFPDVYSAKSESVTYRTDVLTRKMFLGPTTVETVAVKKGITVNVTPTVSYISWSASNLQFNLSLQPCSTIDCHDEIALCEQISSLSYSRNGSKPNVAVYITIAASLITLAICSVLTLYIFNKYFLATLESPEHIQTRTEKISQAEHSFPETHANNVPTNRGDFSTSKLPTKR